MNSNKESVNFNSWFEKMEKNWKRMGFIFCLVVAPFGLDAQISINKLNEKKIESLVQSDMEDLSKIVAVDPNQKMVLETMFREKWQNIHTLTSSEDIQKLSLSITQKLEGILTDDQMASLRLKHNELFDLGDADKVLFKIK